ncbi:MAG: hypothetical protein ABI627_08725 [Polyangiaceae bacterium]
MSRRRLPEVPKAALRDYQASEQVPAVWRRLKAELREQRPSARRTTLAWVWAPALSAVLFGSGVFVGARFIRPQALAGVQAEPPALIARAAGAVLTKNNSEAEPSAGVPQVKALPARARRLATPGAAAREPNVYDEQSEASSHYVAAQPPLVAEWQRFVENGDFAGARRALEQQGGFDVAISHASPSELMSLVDIARASGERGQAIGALRQALAHPDAPEAPLAAWTLGNLLDQAGDEPGAAQAFALYRRLSPAGDFAQDAAARQIDVALAAGNAELVTQLVEDYARDFPHGRRLGEFRKAEKTLAARVADAGAAAKSDAVQQDPEDEADESQSPPGPAAPSPAGSDTH